jgi:hypothetical protein
VLEGLDQPCCGLVRLERADAADPAAGGAPVRNFATRFSVCVLGGVKVAYCLSGWLVRGVSW